MMGGMNPNMNPNMMGGQGGMYGNPFVQNMGGNNMNTGMPNNMGGGQAAPAQQNGNVEQNKVFNV
jgi:hypothetical protein